MESSFNFAAIPVATLARSRAMLRSGCVDGPGVGSSGEGGTDGSRWERGGEGAGFGDGGVIEAEGKDVGVKVVAFVEIDSGAGGGMALVALRGLLDDDFRC